MSERRRAEGRSSDRPSAVSLLSTNCLGGRLVADRGMLVDEIRRFGWEVVVMDGRVVELVSPSGELRASFWKPEEEGS